VSPKKIIFGLDEAGRGALAGPLVAAAACLTLPQKQIEKEANAPIRDSKKLTALQRNRLFTTIVNLNLPTHIATISARQINTRGIGWANKQVFLSLITQISKDQELRTKNLKFIVDGNLKLRTDLIGHPGGSETTDRISSNQKKVLSLRSRMTKIIIQSIPHADADFPEVSLAAIVAKVTRDSYMHELHLDFPHYCWNTNVGYGTRDHIAALSSHGPCPHHRKVFVSSALNKLNA